MSRPGPPRVVYRASPDGGAVAVHTDTVSRPPPPQGEFNHDTDYIDAIPDSHYIDIIPDHTVQAANYYHVALGGIPHN